MTRRWTDPGRLRTHCALQAPTLTGDGAGGHATSWTTVGYLFARLEPQGAASRFVAGQALATVTHVVTLRRRDDVASGMRLVAGGRAFAIETVHDPDETGRFLACLVREEGR
jgi:SPP1 family predicted phage head-tail adaptor